MLGPSPSLTLDGLAQSDPNLDSWESEAPRVCHLGIEALTSTVGRVRSPKGLPTEYSGKQLTAPDPDKAFNAILAVGGGENQATAAQKRSQKSRPVTTEKDFEEKGSHPRLSDLAWSSEDFGTAITRGQLENTASAKVDQMLATLAEANRKAEIAHKTVLGLRDEIAEVRRDNAHLEGLLASEERTQQRKDFDRVRKPTAGRSFRPIRVTDAGGTTKPVETFPNQGGNGRMTP
ncbi:hypothetical protein PanWU01x14_090400 [Parasponia andersonii]|uniref:Uncharacterized protein n=1 Tax=Parasponia andersonii TaxID=3476 RepID=A0A2P5D7P9_PARAD|nr:hypothetical protein PanWU01x14_090400 [Parasponia andersonii]